MAWLCLPSPRPPVSLFRAVYLFLFSRVTTPHTTRGRSEVLRCGLTRLSGDAGHRVLPVLATRDQWSHYWGGSDVQRVGKFFEVTAVAFLGLWACYFASFFLGVATMTVIGTVSEA